MRDPADIDEHDETAVGKTMPFVDGTGTSSPYSRNHA